MWAAQPVCFDNDLPCVDSTIPDIAGVDLSTSGQTGTARDSGQRVHASYTAAMEKEYRVCTDQQRRPEDRNRDLEERLKHYEDEQRGLQDMGRELDERMRQYAAYERRLQDRGSELEEEQRRDKQIRQLQERNSQLQERNRQLQETQGRDKVTISNLHNGQSRLQTKVRQLEDALRSCYNERAREAEDKLLKYREKGRKLKQEHKAYIEKSGQLAEGAELSQTVQPGNEEENAQMEDDVIEHRTPSAPDLGQVDRQRTREDRQSAKQAKHSKGDHSERGVENAAMEGESSGHQNTAPDLRQKHRRCNDKNRQSSPHAPGAKGDDSTSEVVDNVADAMPGPPHAEEETEGLMPKAGVYTQALARKHGMIPLTKGMDAYLYEPQLKVAMQNSKLGDKSKRPYDGTRLGRRLLGLFFGKEERKRGSIAEQPKTGLVRLDKTITESIIMRCLQEDATTTRGKVRDALASSLSAERVIRGKKAATRTEQTQD